MKNIFPFFIILFTVFNTSLPAQPLIIYQDGFEGNWQDRWSATGGSVWQVGIPTLPKAPFSGQNCASTNLNGNYPDNANARLTSAWIQLPTGLPNILFEVMTSFKIEVFGGVDYGKIQIQTRNSTEWIDISPQFKSNGSSVYTRYAADLSRYAGQEIRISFLFVSGSSFTELGWWVDDIKIYSGPNAMTLPESFENGFNGWYSNGAWRVAQPLNGIVAPHGTKVMGTVISGNYGDNIDFLLTSPPLLVPNRNRQPRLRFNYLARLESFGGFDKVYLKIKKQDDTWITIDSFQNISSSWSNYIIDLNDYADQTIAIGFQIVTTSSFNELGYYIDNIDLLVNNTCTTVTTSVSKQNVSCNGGSNGSANVVVTGATNATYQWSNGATSASISNLTAGKYYVTVSGASICTKIDSVQITEPVKVGTTTAIVHPSCENQQSGSLVLSPNGGTPPYTYRWNDGNTTISRYNLGAGNYTFTTTDANNCTFSQTVTLLAPPSVSARILGDSVLQTGGSVTLTATGGSTFRWNTGATSSSITVTSIGTYSVTVSNSNGFVTCSASTSQTVRAATTTTVFTSACQPDTFCYVVRLTSAFSGVNGGVFIAINFNSNAVRPTGFIKFGNIVPLSSVAFLTNSNGVATVTINFTSAAGITGAIGDTLACVFFQMLPNFIRPDTTTNFATNVRFEWLTGQIQNMPLSNTLRVTGVSLRKDAFYWNNQTLVQSNTPAQLRFSSDCNSVSTSYPLSNGSVVSALNSILRFVKFDKKIERQSGPLIHSGQDAYLAYQIYISTITTTSFIPSIYALIAADVNGDGQVSLSDITLILRRSVGDIDGFPQVNSTAIAQTRIFKSEQLTTESHRVSPSYPLPSGNTATGQNIPKVDSCQTLAAFSTNTCDTVQQRWIVVVLGDVDGSVLQAGVQLRGATTVKLHVCGADSSSNNVRRVPITANQATTGIDLKISNFNPNVEWLGIDTGEAMSTAWHKSGQTITISGFSTETNGTKENQILFYLKLKLNNNITLQSALFDTVEAYHNGQTAHVEICRATSTEDKTPPSVFRLFPNPATDEIWIQQSESSHHFLIFNVLGQVIERIPATDKLMRLNISRYMPGTYWMRSDIGGRSLPFIKL